MDLFILRCRIGTNFGLLRTIEQLGILVLGRIILYESEFFIEVMRIRGCTIGSQKVHNLRKCVPTDSSKEETK